MNRYKIVCITQIYNELEKENLKRFVKYVLPLCDALIVYDDGSTDGSYEYVKKFTPYIIRGKKNDFENEIAHKQLLLEKAKKLQADFIFYLDADEVLTAGNYQDLQRLARECVKKGIDGVQFHKINLWRSKTWQRVDSLFDIGWFAHFWRITPEVKYKNIKRGLHQSPYPSTLKKIQKAKSISVLHYGFANEKNIAYKYLTYKLHGQRGYTMLDRLINENKLNLKKVPEKMFPDGLFIKDEPRPQKLPVSQAIEYIEKYRPYIFRPKYSIICLIYKHVSWLEFVYQQILKYTDMSDKEFYFVANDASPEVLEYLKNNYIPHYVWNNTEEQRNSWYINNVYRAYNFGARMAKGDFLVFINSDMAFSKEWLENLSREYVGSNCLSSRFVESGKMKSGLYAIDKNFGRSINTFNETSFQKYAEAIKKRTVKDSGTFGPLLIRKSHFLGVDGYPEGNVVPGSDIFKPKIAKRGEPCVSGDVVLMKKLKQRGIMHQTVFDSIVYHFQEGEKDDNTRSSEGLIERKRILILEKNTFQKLKSFPGVEFIPQKHLNKISEYFRDDTVVVQNLSNSKYSNEKFNTVLYVEEVNKDYPIEKLFKHARRIVTDSSSSLTFYRDYPVQYLPKNIEKQRTFWRTLFENVFQEVAQEIIIREQLKKIPIKKKLRLLFLSNVEKIFDITKGIIDFPILLLKSLKHIIYQKFFHI